MKNSHQHVTRYKGKFRKMFCACNDNWATKRYTGLISCAVAEHACPICGYFPWVYVDKKEEPRRSN